MVKNKYNTHLYGKKMRTKQEQITLERYKLNARVYSQIHSILSR